MSRRALLSAGGVGVAAGCAGPDATSGGPLPAADSSPTPSVAAPTPTRTATRTGGSWRPGPGEVQPEVKVAAVRAVERAGAAEGRTTTVRYAQYGGLLEDRACVMVLAEQAGPGGAAPLDVVVDVRLERRAAGWVVVDERSFSDPGDPLVPPSRSVRALLEMPGLVLPAAARSDLGSGRVDDPVVEILRTLSRHRELSVTVLASGHPRTVFGTPTTSNHTLGRAVDIWAIDGRPVVEMPLDDPVLLGFLRRARDLGSTEIGAPVDPDGPGGVHFANALHRDHVHLGFDP